MLGSTHENEDHDSAPKAVQKSNQFYLEAILQGVQFGFPSLFCLAEKLQIIKVITQLRLVPLSKSQWGASM
eukprot:c5839_g1_i1 orf=102-314(-)